MSTSLKLDGLLAKVESTYGTDSVPTPAENGVRMSERLWGSLTVSHQYENTRENAMSGTLVPRRKGPSVGETAAIEVPVEALGAHSAYSGSNLPEADPLFMACGVSRTVDTTTDSESVTYTPIDTGHGSATLYAYAGGQLFRITGCRGTFRVSMQPGQLGAIVFSLEGKVAEITTTALPAITYQSNDGAIVQGAGFTLNGWAPRIMEGEFDIGNTLAWVSDANAADGLQEYRIQMRDPSQTVTVEAVALSTFDPYALTRNAGTIALALAIGSAQYNRVRITDSACFLRSAPSNEDYEDVAGWGLALGSESPVVVFD